MPLRLTLQPRHQARLPQEGLYLVVGRIFRRYGPEQAQGLLHLPRFQSGGAGAEAFVDGRSLAGIAAGTAKSPQKSTQSKPQSKTLGKTPGKTLGKGLSPLPAAAEEPSEGSGKALLLMIHLRPEAFLRDDPLALPPKYLEPSAQTVFQTFDGLFLPIRPDHPKALYSPCFPRDPRGCPYRCGRRSFRLQPPGGEARAPLPGP